MYERINISAFTTVKAKAPKLFQVCEVLLILHVYCTEHNVVYWSLVC